MGWMRVAINIPKEYGPTERAAIGEVVVEFIRYRTHELGLDKNNRPFARYSRAYTDSLNFKIAHKSRGDVNLSQSGDMLGALSVLSHRSGVIVIGYERGSKENGIAEGNIKGTYGRKFQVGPKRDFLGITKSDLARILASFPLHDREESKNLADTIVGASNTAGTINNIFTDNFEEVG